MAALCLRCRTVTSNPWTSLGYIKNKLNSKENISYDMLKRVQQDGLHCFVVPARYDEKLFT